MSDLDYFTEKKNLEDKFKKDMQGLVLKFALERNQFTEGDIITDGNTIIEISSISVMTGEAKLPFCVYHGKQMRSNLQYYRKSSRQVLLQLYQSNKLRKIIK